MPYVDIADKTTLDSVKSDTGNILSKLSGGSGAIKSIQILKISNDNATEKESFGVDPVEYKDYTISNIDKNKTIIIINSAASYNNASVPTCAIILNNTTIRVYRTSKGAIRSVVVQVIEFN